MSCILPPTQLSCRPSPESIKFATISTSPFLNAASEDALLRKHSLNDIKSKQQSRRAISAFLSPLRSSLRWRQKGNPSIRYILSSTDIEDLRCFFGARTGWRWESVTPDSPLSAVTYQTMLPSCPPPSCESFIRGGRLGYCVHLIQHSGRCHKVHEDISQAMFIQRTTAVF